MSNQRQRRLITLRTFTAADLASSDNQHADDTCIMTAGMAVTGDVFFLDKFIAHGMETVGILREVIRQMRVFRSWRGFIEKNRFEGIMKTCRMLVQKGFYGNPGEVSKIINRIMLIPHYKESKEDRILGTLQQTHEAHKLWFRSEWVDVKEQFLLYPGVEHDDILDTIEMLVAHASSPHFALEQSLPRSIPEVLQKATGNKSINEIMAARPYSIWTGQPVRKG